MNEYYLKKLFNLLGEINLDRIIKKIIDKKIANDIIVLSPANIKIDIVANKNIDVKESDIIESDIKKILRTFNGLLEINEDQFIQFNSIIKILGYDIYHNFIKEKNYKDLINIIRYIILKNYPVFDINIKLIKDYIIHEETRRKIRTEIVNSLNDLFFKENKSVHIDEIMKLENYNFDKTVLQKELFNNNIFYEITPKRFALNSWILLDIVKNGFHEYNIVSFKFIINIVTDLLNTIMINKKNLKKLLENRPEFSFIDQDRKIKINTNFEILKNNLANFYQEYIFIDKVKLYYDRDKYEKSIEETEKEIDYETILQEGLSNGYVRMNELNKINYNESKIKSKFEAMKILDERGIEVFFE